MCLSLSLNWLDWIFQAELSTSDLFVPLAQLIRSHVASRAPNLRFVRPSRSIDQVTCCKQGSRPHFCLPLSLSWPDYMLQTAPSTFDLLAPLAQLIRVWVANGTVNLGLISVEICAGHLGLLKRMKITTKYRLWDIFSHPSNSPIWEGSSYALRERRCKINEKGS